MFVPRRGIVQGDNVFCPVRLRSHALGVVSSRACKIEKRSAEILIGFESGHHEAVARIRSRVISAAYARAAWMSACVRSG